MNFEPSVWVLNLDAEDELAHQGPHTPSAAMVARIEGFVARLAEAPGLIGPFDQVLWPGRAVPQPGRPGRAWCPTRWALTRFEEAGVTVAPVPSGEVLRAVNHRRFSHQLGQSLPGAGYATDAKQLELLMNEAQLEKVSISRNWLLKRPFGYAGRGRRKIRWGDISLADRAWLEASLRTGEGLQVEPLVEREFDCALHGWLSAEGQVTFGELTLQRIDEAGVWQGSSLADAGTLSLQELHALHDEAHRTARALQHAGYFGPFGLDAFRWRSPDGERHFQPRSEVNARYSMGWSVGMQRSLIP